METNEICPHCGKEVLAAALGGVCPECMLRVGAAETREAGAGGTALPKPSRRPAPSVAELAPHFPQLEILECLGCGGMGAVYKARQPMLDRLVALKILTRTAGELTDTEFAGRFQREARALARLNHPDIVAVYDFGEAGGRHYLLMEFVDGLNLRQVMRTERLDPSEALDIVPKICAALQFAHDRGIVHRDIKPENILLDKDGQVKIADFGIAKMLGVTPANEALTGAKDIIGTPHYMAPEQIEQPQTVDHRADIYSLGVVFYEMLTGELPLGKFAPPSKKVRVDVRLDEVVLHALEKEPDRRYQRASEVKTDVETIAESSRRDLAVAIDTSRAPAGISSWVSIARWTARILGTLLLFFYGAFVLGEGFPPLASKPGGVQLNFIALSLMLGGFVIGWKREGAAALLIAGGWTLWRISEGGFALNLFQKPLAVAALYAFCWWETKGRRTGVLAAATATLAVTLVLGRLFVPANVHLSGTHNFRLTPANSATTPVPDPALDTRIQLSPPVVIETVPESGAMEVDPALTELRVTFSKPMQDASWSWAIWNEENFPRMTAPPRYLPDERTCILPVQLDRGKTYAIWINSENHFGFRDAIGNPAVPYLLIFQTRN
jgi:predicted Ser/Thr protein kinase